MVGKSVMGFLDNGTEDIRDMSRPTTRKEPKTSDSKCNPPQFSLDSGCSRGTQARKKCHHHKQIRILKNILACPTLAHHLTSIFLHVGLITMPLTCTDAWAIPRVHGATKGSQQPRDLLTFPLHLMASPTLKLSTQAPLVLTCLPPVPPTLTHLRIYIIILPRT